MKKLVISVLATISLLFSFIAGYLISGSFSSRTLEDTSLFLQAHSSYRSIGESIKLIKYIENGCIDAVKASLEFQLKYDEYFVSEHLKDYPTGQLSRLVSKKYGRVENFLSSAKALPPKEIVYPICKGSDEDNSGDQSEQSH